MEIFYRKNDKSTNVLLENFFNNNINSLIEEYKSNQIALNLLKIIFQKKSFPILLQKNI